MGHWREAEFDNYFANVINLDTQSCFLDLSLQQGLVNKGKGMTVHRDLWAPKQQLARQGISSR